MNSFFVSGQGDSFSTFVRISDRTYRTTFNVAVGRVRAETWIGCDKIRPNKISVDYLLKQHRYRQQTPECWARRSFAEIGQDVLGIDARLDDHRLGTIIYVMEDISCIVNYDVRRKTFDLMLDHHSSGLIEFLQPYRENPVLPPECPDPETDPEEYAAFWRKIQVKPPEPRDFEDLPREFASYIEDFRTRMKVR